MQHHKRGHSLHIGLLAAIPILVTGSIAHAGPVPPAPPVIYKCKTDDGKLLYSDAPCAEQAAKKVKVMRAEELESSVRDTKRDSAEGPVNRKPASKEPQKPATPEANRPRSVPQATGGSASRSISPAPPSNKQPSPPADSWMHKVGAWLKLWFD